MAIQAPITPARAGERGRLRKPQLGPVTLAIRALRRNEAPSWEIRQTQINAEERAALAGLRQRIKAQIRSDLDRVDRCLNALNLIDGDADIEQDVGEMAEGGLLNANLDDEPSLCGITVDTDMCFRRSGQIAEDGEICAGDEPEHDEAERGFGDMDGALEQMGAYA